MNKFIRIGFVMFALAIVAPAIFAPANVHALEDGQQTCDRGPIAKTIGGTDWLVYGCTDDLTIIFVSTENSPAYPFFFVLYPENGAYALHGEGSGNQLATKAAHDDLAALSRDEIQALLDETKQAM